MPRLDRGVELGYTPSSEERQPDELVLTEIAGQPTIHVTTIATAAAVITAAVVHVRT